MRSKQIQSIFPLFIILFGILFSLYLVWQIKGEIFYSGDAGIKALLAKQFASGKFQLDLDLAGDAWVRQLWKNGLYPFEPPFVYKQSEQYFITFPVWFSLISAPFYFLFGFRGFYLIPLIATWLIWIKFYRVCQQLKLEAFLTSAAIAILVFSSPLSLYSAMYWEHNLSVFLALYGVTIVLFPKSDQLSKKDALLGGLLIGLSAWFRSELLSFGILFCGLLYWVSLVNFQEFKFLRKQKNSIFISLLVTLSVLLIFNQITYGHALGMHSVQVVEKFSLLDRFKVGIDNFEILVAEFVYTFPIVGAVTFYFLINPKLEPKLTFLFLVCLLFIVTVALIVPAGAGGKQWGSRFLLVLIPFISIIGAVQLRAIVKIFSFRPWLYTTSIASFTCLFILGVYININSGVTELTFDYKNRILPALNFLNKHPANVVTVPNQFIAQELVSSFERKQFFLIKDRESFKKLGTMLIERKQENFLHICNRYSDCFPLKDKSDEFQLLLDADANSIQFSKLKNAGIYTFYEASVASSK